MPVTISIYSHISLSCVWCLYIGEKSANKSGWSPWAQGVGCFETIATAYARDRRYANYAGFRAKAQRSHEERSMFLIISTSFDFLADLLLLSLAVFFDSSVARFCSMRIIMRISFFFSFFRYNLYKQKSPNLLQRTRADIHHRLKSWVPY